MTAFRAIVFILLLCSESADAFRLQSNRRNKRRHVTTMYKATDIVEKQTKAEFSNTHSDKYEAETLLKRLTKERAKRDKLKEDVQTKEETVVTATNEAAAANAKLRAQEDLVETLFMAMAPAAAQAAIGSNEEGMEVEVDPFEVQVTPAPTPAPTQADNSSNLTNGSLWTSQLVGNHSFEAENSSKLKNASLWTSQLDGNYSLVGISSFLDSPRDNSCGNRKPVLRCELCSFKDDHECMCDRPKADLQKDGGRESIYRVTCNPIKTVRMGGKGCRRSDRRFSSKEECTRAIQAHSQGFQHHEVQPLSITTWNIAAVNTNPFEFWNNGYPEYDELIKAFDQVIAGKILGHVYVRDVFDAYIQDLSVSAEAAEKKPSPFVAAKVKQIYDAKVSGLSLFQFFDQWKDKQFAAARWISWPDRKAQVQDKYRPSVITPCLDGFGDGRNGIQTWWDSWKHFMFQDGAFQKLQELEGKYHNEVKKEDLEDNIEKQLMYLAVFDAIFVYLMFSVNHKWLDVKTRMVSALVNGKNKKTLSVLENHIEHKGPDIICLQEASQDFASMLGKLNKYELFQLKPDDRSGKQDSILLLKRERFPTRGTLVTPGEIQDVGKGDLVTVFAKDAYNVPFLISSFHGTSNGLSTFNVIPAVVDYNKLNGQNEGYVLFGMDANTFPPGKGKEANADKLIHDVRVNAMATAWGKTYSHDAWITTNKARTSVQAQLDKMVTEEELQKKADRSPKDHILHEADFTVQGTFRENSDDGWKDEMFPSAAFPSDHAIVSTTIYRTESAGQDIARATRAAAAVVPQGDLPGQFKTSVQRTSDGRILAELR